MAWTRTGCSLSDSALAAGGPWTSAIRGMLRTSNGTHASFGFDWGVLVVLNRKAAGGLVFTDSDCS